MTKKIPKPEKIIEMKEDSIIVYREVNIDTQRAILRAHHKVYEERNLNVMIFFLNGTQSIETLDEEKMNMMGWFKNNNKGVK